MRNGLFRSNHNLLLKNLKLFLIVEKLSLIRKIGFLLAFCEFTNLHFKNIVSMIKNQSNVATAKVGYCQV